jgi:hypothetical protein
VSVPVVQVEQILMEPVNHVMELVQEYVPVQLEAVTVSWDLSMHITLVALLIVPTLKVDLTS